MYMYPSTRMLAHSRAPHIFSQTYPSDMTVSDGGSDEGQPSRVSHTAPPLRGAVALPPSRPQPSGWHHRASSDATTTAPLAGGNGCTT